MYVLAYCSTVVQYLVFPYMMNSSMTVNDFKKKCLICILTQRKAVGFHDGCTCSDFFRNKPTQMKEEEITFGQINLHHAELATTELIKRLMNRNLIALVTEPWVKGDTNIHISIPKSLSVYCSSKLVRCRASIITRREVKLWPVDSMSSGDLAVAVLPLEHTSVIIASCYWDILHDEIDPLVLKLISFCRERRIPLMMGMDSNAHSTLWGSQLSNNRGRKLEEWIFEENLTVVNTGGNTFHSSRASTAIDVTLINEYIHGIGGWYVDEGPSFSDHKWIQFKYQGKSIQVTNYFRNTRGADWGYFSDCLNDIKIPQEVVHTERGIEDASDWLQERIWEGINEVAPRIAPFTGGRPRWWNKSLEVLRKMVRKAFKALQTLPSAKNADKYHMYRNSYTRQIRRAKKWAWKKFTTQLNQVAEIGRTAKALRFGRQKEIGILQKNGEILIDPATSMEEMMRVHFPEHRQASLRGA